VSLFLSGFGVMVLYGVERYLFTLSGSCALLARLVLLS
jgi:hypothetical protein